MNNHTPKTISKHGKSHSKIYKVWEGMVARCTNPTNNSYPRYGKIGITVCDEWRNSFQNFYNHVSTLPYYAETGYSLDRINNNLGYFPGNIQWSTPKEQARNTRSNRWIELNGEIRCLAEWEKITGIHRKTISRRIDIHGWSIEKALTTPVKKKLS